MKTAIIASTLLLGFAAASTPSSANVITIDSLDVTELSVGIPERTETAPLLHDVKGHKGKSRGGHNRGGRDRNRNNLASDGNIGNGTLRARIQHEQRYSNRSFAASKNGGFGPFGFFRRIFGN